MADKRCAVFIVQGSETSTERPDLMMVSFIMGKKSKHF